ncbi:hypothetical protein EGI11_03545 [Chryseobacterium sp. H3056]|uniref:Uncharacterized protein n=1 Tax=Kaistella daneshvariae TaxID=2487074 RepID=A0A3N0WXR3_9FLAO|nr:hypothetical protein EGI11_03545 [Kaistella daneshvariae]
MVHAELTYVKKRLLVGVFFIWAPLSALRSRFFARRSSSQKELHSGRGASRHRKFATISKFSFPEKFPAKTPKFLDLYFRKNLAKTLNFPTFVVHLPPNTLLFWTF